MKKICQKLKKDIIKAAEGVLNPYEDAFQPKDLHLNANKYGSFSDHCVINTTKSSKWCGCGLLKRLNNKRPFKYILKKQD